jgi:hypothetical protein
MPPRSTEVIAIPVLREPQGPVFRISARFLLYRRMAIRPRTERCSSPKYIVIPSEAVGSSPTPRQAETHPQRVNLTPPSPFEHVGISQPERGHSTTVCAITRLGTRCATICGLNQTRRAQMNGRGRGWARGPRATCAGFRRTARTLYARP